MSLGIGSFAASGANLKLPPTITYMSNGRFTGGGNKSASISLGADETNRCLILWAVDSLTSGNVTGRTVNGAAPSVVSTRVSNAQQCFWLLKIPTGASTTLVYNTQFTSSIDYMWYVVRGLVDASVYSTAFNMTDANTTSNTIDIPVNGAALGFRRTVAGVNGAYGTTWSGMNSDTTTSGAANTIDRSCANVTVATGQTARAVSAATNYGGKMGLISFGNGS